MPVVSAKNSQKIDHNIDKRKLGYKLPVKKSNERFKKIKLHEVIDCPNHRNKIIIEKLKIQVCTQQLFNFKSETDYSCSSFPERPTPEELKVFSNR